MINSFLILFRGSNCLFIWLRHCLDRQIRLQGVRLYHANTVYRIVWWRRAGRRYWVYKWVLVHFSIHFCKSFYVSTYFTNQCVDIINFVFTLLRNNILRIGLHLWLLDLVVFVLNDLQQMSDLAVMIALYLIQAVCELTFITRINFLNLYNIYKGRSCR